MEKKRAVFCLSLDEVVDVDVEVIFKLDEVHRGLGLHLLYDQADPLAPVLPAVLHVFAHQAVHHLAWLWLLWGRLVCGSTQHSAGLTFSHKRAALTTTSLSNAICPPTIHKYK